MHFEEFMRTIAKGINNTLEQHFGYMGFVLLVFPFNTDTEGANYVTNANRKDIIKMLRETADRLEKKEDIPTPVNNRRH